MYSHRFFICGRQEFLVSSGVEVYFMLILCVLKISCGIYVLVCDLASVFVLRGFDVWSLRRYFLCCICVLTVFGVFIPLGWCWCWDTVTIARSVSDW
jgi:hypothetical protein